MTVFDIGTFSLLPVDLWNNERAKNHRERERDSLRRGSCCRDGNGFGNGDRYYEFTKANDNKGVEYNNTLLLSHYRRVINNGNGLGKPYDGK